MWTVIVNADTVYEVWPDDRRNPCATTLGPEDNNYAILTSHPYPVQFIDGLGMKVAKITDVQLLQGYIEGLDLTSEVTSIFLRSILKSYDDWPPEGIEYAASEVTSILLKQKLVRYLNWPAEGLEYSPSEVTSISLVTP